MGQTFLDRFPDQPIEANRQPVGTALRLRVHRNNEVGAALHEFLDQADDEIACEPDIVARGIRGILGDAACNMHATSK